MRRNFRDLSAQEVLALAISLEEEDARIFREFARLLRPNFPKAAISLDAMCSQEDGHRRRLIDMFQKKFGDEIPLVRRHDVRGFVRRDPVQSLRVPTIEHIRKRVALMELEAARYYEKAAQEAKDAELRKLLGDLAAEERKHEETSAAFDPEHQSATEREEEARTSRQLFVLQVVQPGLAGLMDGSVSTLAPLFASAFATRNCWSAFLVGMAAAVGAGISMGFAEALSDDGSLTGRGRPLLRGLTCGAMTFVGGVGHALPFLISNFVTAMVTATIIVIVELLAIAWIRNRYMDTPFLAAAFQVVVGGVLVFISGILIGSA
jgi:rubrerythrin